MGEKKMNDIVIPLNWSIITGVSFAILVFGIVFKKYKTRKLMFKEDADFMDKENIRKNKESELRSISETFRLIELSASDQQIVTLDDGDDLVAFYEQAVTGVLKGQEFSSASDFNKFLHGMMLSGDNLSSFDKTKTENTIEIFSDYAQISAFSFVKDIKYLDAKVRIGKLEEIKVFLSSNFSFRFTNIQNPDDLFELLRLLSLTTVPVKTTIKKYNSNPQVKLNKVTL